MVVLVSLAVAVALFAQTAIDLSATSVMRTPKAGVIVNSVSISRGVGNDVGNGVGVRNEPLKARAVDVYCGYGVWVDMFDYSSYNRGETPPVTVQDLDEMAANGVRTIYLQAARADTDISTQETFGLQDKWLLARWLIGAHERGIAVVAWYSPRWQSDESDIRRVKLLDAFNVLGHRFDGIAINIEWRDDALTAAEQNKRLINFSKIAKLSVGEPLAAVVPSPVQLEVTNRDYWPNFPWKDMSDIYDVWLLKSYWSFHTDDYGDGYSHYYESVKRLRSHLGLQALSKDSKVLSKDNGETLGQIDGKTLSQTDTLLIHGVGGIGGTQRERGVSQGAQATIGSILAFVNALEDTESIGGSIYDWNTLDRDIRSEVASYFTRLHLN